MRIIIFLLSFFIVENIIAQKQDKKVIIKDLSYDWLAYDDDENYYFPIVNFFENQYNTRTLYQDFEHNETYSLTFFSEPDLCLFVNNQLFRKFSEKKEVDVKLSEILKKASNSKKVILTFYHPESFVPLQIYKTYIPIQSNYLAHSDLYQIIKKPIQAEKETLIMSFFVFIGLMTYLKYNSSIWFDAYFNFLNVLYGRNVEDSILSRVLNSKTFLIIVIISLLFNLNLKLLNLKLLHFYYFVLPDNYQYVGLFITGTIYIVVFLLIKYWFLYLASMFLKIGQFYKLHYFQSIRMYLLILLILFLVTLFRVNFNVFSYFLVISFLFWLFRLGLLVKKEVGFRKIYLFSYLCILEIIPVVLLLKQLTVL